MLVCQTHTARFHQFASFLVNIKINVFSVKLSAAAGRITADNLPFFRTHILTVSPSLLLDFFWTNGRRPSPLKRTRTAPPLRATGRSVQALEGTGASIQTTSSTSSITTRHRSPIKTQIKTIPNTIRWTGAIFSRAVSRCGPTGRPEVKRALFEWACVQGRGCVSHASVRRTRNVIVKHCRAPKKRGWTAGKFLIFPWKIPV